MKKLLSMILAIILAFGLMPVFSAHVEAAGVKINSTNFPDAVFRNYILENLDTDGNGTLSTDELAAVEDVYLSNLGIENLKGIALFTELKWLDCSDNALTSLDVSANTKLVSLTCSGNAITSLNVTKNTALVELYCAYNPLGSLDVTKNTLLEILICFDTGLAEIDVTKNTRLTFLSCGTNSIKSLDLSRNTKLEYLECSENPLTGLNLTKNVKLDSLSCYKCGLKKLDLTKNTVLTYLYCAENKLTALDLTKNTELEHLYCSVNSLKSLDLTKNTKLLNVYAFSNSLTSLDISKNTKLKNLHVTGNDLPGLDISKNTYLKKAFNNSDGANGYYRYNDGEYAFSVDEEVPVYASMTDKPVVTAQSGGESVKVGETATFSADGGRVTSIQWYYRTSQDGEWTAVSSINGKKFVYSLTAEARHDGYQYRCKLTNSVGSVYTKTVTLLVASEKPAVVTQPKDQYKAIDGTAAFTVEASGGGLSYQWQYRTGSSGTWQSVAAASGRTATYNLKVAARHDGYQYRCVVQNVYGKAYTSARTLRVVTEKPTITTQPKNKTVTEGKKASFTVAADGLGITYQWYYRTGSSGEWKKVSSSSGRTATYSLTAAARHNGYQYRCRVMNPAGYVYTKTVTLTVN